ncbi:MAG: hypothetical protein DHS20C13_15540 [Thermodesulfobacteriota bacterium]|nr:MAG: hypothetical protein DHS20C13_15540 [Thermodesulfobacteriota bacterium]
MRLYRANLFIFLLGLLLLGHFTSISEAQSEKMPSASEIILILDASGSMWGQIEGQNKIAIAKEVLKGLVSELPDDTEVGLIAYGHREKGDCKDIETIVQPAPLDKASINQKIDALNPKGKTPITDSVLTAFELVKANENATTVILVSDGIETCGGDPCKAVKEAKEAGINFIMHVVGFDVGDVDVSELECAAQAGGGLYMSAQNASELSEALETAVEIPAELPMGKLSVKVTGEGKLQDAYLILTNTTTGEELKGQRTYTKPTTNPRIISLPDGVYDLEIKPQGMKGVQSKSISGIEIKEGEVIEKEIYFGFGELSIKVVRNEKLMDSTVHIINPDTEERVAQGRTYSKSTSNPIVMKLDPGVYDVEITALEIATSPKQTFSDIEIVSGEIVEKVVDYSSGTLKVGALKGEKLHDAVVRIIDSSTEEQVAQGRTYTGSKSNPKTFELPPGIYNVIVEPLGIKGVSPQAFDNIEVKAGEIVEDTAQFSGGTLKVGALQGEKLLDAVVYIKNSETGEQVAQGRTYKSSNTNPKTFELSPGIYDVSVKALGITNNPMQEFKGIEITPAESLVKEAQFESGTLKIGAKDGERLVDANISIKNTNTGENVTAGRTYPKSKSNPKVFELTPGTYDVVVTALKMNTKSSKEFESIELKAGDTIEEIVQFPRGTIKVSTTQSEENIKAVVRVKDPKTGEQLAYGYTDLKASKNPIEFILPPGSYEVVVEPYKMDEVSEKVFNIDLRSEDDLDLKVDFPK